MGDQNTGSEYARESVKHFTKPPIWYIKCPAYPAIVNKTDRYDVSVTALTHQEILYAIDDNDGQLRDSEARTAGKGLLIAITSRNDEWKVTRILDGEERAVIIKLVDGRHSTFQQRTPFRHGVSVSRFRYSTTLESVEYRVDYTLVVFVVSPFVFEGERWWLF